MDASGGFNLVVLQMSQHNKLRCIAMYGSWMLTAFIKRARKLCCWHIGRLLHIWCHFASEAQRHLHCHRSCQRRVQPVGALQIDEGCVRLAAANALLKLAKSPDNPVSADVYLQLALTMQARAPTSSTDVYRFCCCHMCLCVRAAVHLRLALAMWASAHTCSTQVGSLCCCRMQLCLRTGLYLQLALAI